MHSFPSEIAKPTHDADFEEMCARIYGHVFKDNLPTKNGRRGQAQGGVDIFVDSAKGRIGIQCKRYVDGALTLAGVTKELERADRVNQPVVQLIIATQAIEASPRSLR